MAKEKAIQIVLPAGVAAYAWLSKPDSGQKFSNDKYKVTLVYDNDDTLTEVEQTCLAAAKAKWPGVKPADVKLPMQDGNDKTDKDGNPREDFADKTLITAQSKFKPAQVDAKKRPLPANVSVFSGDLIKAAVTLYLYEKTEKVKVKGKTVNETVHGVSFQLGAVQLLDKRNTGSAGADAFDEEEGYEAPEGATTEAGGEDGGNADF